ncbi:DUF5684 domain-containing protein [Microbacterium sp. X-17]|uniref:DUF5684 domain-containing protein n=1 Tax=Microbacterium sp. X-17 TaxID=3144404 RepID=UPI0031F518FD
MTDTGLIALGVSGLVAIALYVWTAIALSAVFRKAGEAGGKAWVPFLNAAVVLALGGFSGWLVLIVLVPLFGALLLYVSIVVAAHHINRAFGLGGGMTVLAALLFPVWASVVGFGSARWLASDENVGPSRNATVALSFPDLDGSGRGRTSSLLDGPRPYPEDGLRVMPLPPEPVPVPAPASVAPAPAPDPASWFRAGDEVAPPAPRPQPEPPRLAPEPLLTRPTPADPGILRAPDAYAGTEDEAFPEASGAVSAVVGAPRAGAPRSALSSVSAQHAEPESDFPDETIIARRRRPAWSLHPAGGAPVPLAGERVIVGRRPAPDPLQPDAQLVAITDPTRTVSKTHALLRRRGETWYLTDLGSTNGVVFMTVLGAEVDAEPGVEVEAGERFLLGDLEVRIARDA